MNQQRYQTIMLYLSSLLWLILWCCVLPWPAYGWLILLASYFVADVGSYMLHYIVDFYGDAQKPGIIREFQLHHENPAGIVQASLADVMFPAAWIVSPLLGLLAAITVAGWLPGGMALSLSVLGLCWSYAQLFHRWTHQHNTNRVIRLLQQTRLILTPNAHDQHHVYPYKNNYAVVNGWSNRLLDSLHMPRLLDALLARLGFSKRVPE